jgi:hypothetical protein
METERSKKEKSKMTRTKTVSVFAALAGAILLVGLPAWAKWQAKTADKPAAQTAAKSFPEMDRLKFYLGEWDYTETYPKTALNPSGGQNTGVYSSKLGPGGNSLINHFHSQGPVGDFEGLQVMTWDPKEGAYKAYVFGNGFPGAIIETGHFEDDTLVYRLEFSMGDTKMALRNVTRVVGPGRLVSEEYSSVGGAPEVLLVRVEAKKR